GHVVRGGWQGAERVRYGQHLLPDLPHSFIERPVETKRGIRLHLAGDVPEISLPRERTAGVVEEERETAEGCPTRLEPGDLGVGNDHRVRSYEAISRAKDPVSTPETAIKRITERRRSGTVRRTDETPGRPPPCPTVLSPWQSPMSQPRP